MAKKHTAVMPEAGRVAMFERARSGAAGIHQDQKARRAGAVGRANRQGARTSRLRSAIADQDT